MAEAAGPVQAALNGLRISLDAQSGSILRLEYDGPGALLEAEPSEAGIVDLAYPLPNFEPLRLASRFSHDVKIARAEGGLVLSWDALGTSRPFAVAGKVSAEVRLTSTPDGQSIVMSCQVRNQSERAVRQVIFPDLAGLVPTDGIDHTYFKTGGFGSAPFRELQLADGDEFYAQSNAFREYTSGGMFDPMWMRWMDLGGLKGGLSLFPRRWGWDPKVTVLLHLSPTTHKLRLMCLHPVEVKPGETWESGEFVLTPHRSGWAKGIEPYREWVRAHLKREYPVPEHIRRGLGYRTLWMCQNQPHDPADVVWRFGDLPRLAQEAKEHGLTEMVLWAWCPGFALPLPGPFPHLGTEAEFAAAIKECRRIGVNVAPFISVLQANKATGPRYGLSVPETGGWTYHTELIPRFNPPYAGAYACAQVATNNQLWQDDIVASVQHLIDLGVTSLSWDQYLAVPGEPNIHTLTSRIRALAKPRDPESTFSGEELYNLELDAGYLDYTWNWGGYRDCQAFTSVFRAPRANVNVNTSVWTVKRAFADNLFLNVWPSRPGSVNGSDLIANHADLSRALKQCAKLRAQFLTYFTEGTFIGYCLLTETSPGATVCGYVLPDRALALVVNEGGERPVTLRCDVGAWVPTPSGRFEVRSYDNDGALLATTQAGTGPVELTTKALQNLEIAVYEFVAK